MTTVTVRDFVLEEIARASGVPPANLRDDLKLQADLVIAHQNYVVLAQNLDAFIQENNANQSLALSDIDTPAATVGSVITLVSTRIAA